MSRKLMILAAVMFWVVPATVHADYQDAVLALNPTIYYQLDEASGTTANDATVNGFDGAYVGETRSSTSGSWTDWPAAPGGTGPRPSDGYATMSSNNTGATVVKGSAGKLGGQAIQYNSASTTAGISKTAYSVSLWFKASNDLGTYPDDSILDSLNYLFGRSNTGVENVPTDWSFQDALAVSGYQTNGKICLVFFDVPGDTQIYDSDPTTIDANTWYHAAFVRDGSNAYGYLNGELEFSGTSVLDMTDPDGSEAYTGDTMVFGNRSDYLQSGHFGLEGVVDEVAVFNGALDADQVKGLYTAAVPEPSTVVLLLSLFATALVWLKRRR